MARNQADLAASGNATCLMDVNTTCWDSAGWRTFWSPGSKIGAGYGVISGSEQPQQPQRSGLGHYLYPLQRSELSDMVNLPDDWDGYGAKPPSSKAVEQAQHVLRMCFGRELVPVAVLPSSEGGVGIAFMRTGRYADIEMLNNKTVLAVVSGDDTEPEVWSLTFTDDCLEEAIGRIKSHING